MNRSSHGVGDRVPRCFHVSRRGGLDSRLSARSVDPPHCSPPPRRRCPQHRRLVVKGAIPCSRAPLTVASSALRRWSASASGSAARRSPWWVEHAVGQRQAARRRRGPRRARPMIRRPSSTCPSSRPSSLSVISAPSSKSRVCPRSWTSAAVSRRSCSRRGCSTHVSTASVPDRDRVLEQPAEVGVVAVARARRAAQRRAQLAVSEQVAQQRGEPRVADLAREVLEEAVELVEVAVGHGQERRRVGVVRAGDRAQLELQLLAEALDAARDAHEVAAARSARPARSASRNTRAAIAPGAVAQLHREVGRARARDQSVLARAGEDAADLVAGAQVVATGAPARRRAAWRDRAEGTNP